MYYKACALFCKRFLENTGQKCGSELPPRRDSLPPDAERTRKIWPPGDKTSEGTLRQNAGTLFSEINCKQIANGTGEKCGGPAGHEIGEENREISGKLNALRPCRGGERISVLVNYGRNAP